MTIENLEKEIKYFIDCANSNLWGVIKNIFIDSIKNIDKIKIIL